MKRITRKMLEKCYVCGRSTGEFFATFDLGAEVSKDAELPPFEPHLSKFYVETTTGKRIIPVPMEMSEDSFEDRFFSPNDVEEDYSPDGSSQLKVKLRHEPLKVIRETHYDSVAAETHAQAEAEIEAAEKARRLLPRECQKCRCHGVTCEGIQCINAAAVTEISLYYALCPVCTQLLSDPSHTYLHI